MVDVIVLAEVRVDAIFYIEDERTKVRQPIKEMAQRSVISEMDLDPTNVRRDGVQSEREVERGRERKREISTTRKRWRSRR